MEIQSELKLTQSEVLSLLIRFDDSSDSPLHEGLDFDSYSKKLSDFAFFIIATDNGSQIGFIAYYLNEEGKFAYVPQIVVHKEGRHKGVGHAMFAKLFDSVKDNYSSVKLEVLKSNVNARNFYNREGFVEIEDHNERTLLVKNMKEKLLIVGTGSLTPEVVSFVRRYDLYDIIGFSVDQNYLTEDYMGLPVYPFESLDQYVDKESVKVFISVSWYNYMNRYKRQKFEMLKARGFHFANLLSPTAIVNAKCIGEGNWICDMAYVDYDVIIGDNNTLLPQTNIGHYSILGNHNVLSGRACVAGETNIGNQNYIGFNCTVFNKLTIGNKCLIGGGTVVNRNLCDCSVVSAPESKFYTVKESMIEKLLSPSMAKNVQDSY